MDFINYKNELQIYSEYKRNFFDKFTSSPNLEIIQLLENEFNQQRKKYIYKIGNDYEPYPNNEKELKLTRNVLSLIYKYGHGLAIFTANKEILNDLDILKKINNLTVFINLTINNEASSILEPTLSSLNERLETIKKLKKEKIKVCAIINPVLPSINDNLTDLIELLENLKNLNLDGIILLDLNIPTKTIDKTLFMKGITKYYPELKRDYKKLLTNNYLKTQYEKYLTLEFNKFCQNNNIPHNKEDIYNNAYEFEDEISYEQISLF